METVLKILSEMRDRGLIGQYAIGGGMGVLYYTEPFLTYDLDIFVFLPEKEGFIDISRVYSFLKSKGYSKMKGEAIFIGDFPVQLIHPPSELEAEAIHQAIEKPYGKAIARVFRPEHLAAILLKTYRPKDKEHLAKIIDQSNLNPGKFRKILKKYNLEKKWERFKKEYR